MQANRWSWAAGLVPWMLLAGGAVGCSDEPATSPSASLAGSDDAATLNDGVSGATDDATTALDVQVPDDVAAVDGVAGTDAVLVGDGTAAGDATPGADTLVAPDVPIVPDSFIPPADATGDSGQNGGQPDTSIDANPALCGNGYCDAGETPKTCSADCKGFSWTCGDGVCDIGEEFYCQNDCVKPVCGDGKCEPGEQSAGCTQDCKAGGFCGDNICQTGENGTNCPKDCGIGTWTCGDGKCDFGEQFYCFKDCTGGPTDAVTCLKAKCANDYGNCTKDPGCTTALQCMIGCNGDWGCLQGCVQAAGGSGAAAVQVTMCGQSNGCL